MSNTKKSQNGSKSERLRQAKKAIILETNAGSRKPVFIVALGLLLVIAAAVSVYLGLHFQGSQAVATTTAASEVEYPVSMFSDGKARHFEHQAGKHTIRYFVLKSSDGIIRAAFDACDVCWPANKGYFQDGDVMVCRNCGRKFASVRINEVKGGCNPAPLERRVESGNLVIRIQDILKGRQYFNFS